MSKQANIALFLGFLFVVWLFTQSFFSLVNKKSELTYNYARLKQENAKLIEERDVNYRYAMLGEGQNLPYPIVYDKVTGETWRYFRNISQEEKTIVDEGWVRLPYYPGLGLKAVTPEIAQQSLTAAVQNLLKAETEKLEGQKQQEGALPRPPEAETLEQEPEEE